MHPEIEKLIDLIIIDGQITEKERDVIIKKAKELGVDLDEVIITLDAKLYQKEAPQTKVDKKYIKQEQIQKSNKEGVVKKCPSCGAQVNAFKTNCNECGLEFREVQSSSSLKDFFNQIENAKPENRAVIIANFPVPNTKEDLVEFITMAIGNSKKLSQGEKNEYFVRTFGKTANEDYRENDIKAWAAKAKSIILKTKLIYSDDANMISSLNTWEKELYNLTSDSLIDKSNQYFKIGCKFFVLLIILIGVFYFIKACCFVSNKFNQFDSINKNIQNQITIERKTVDSLLILDKVEDALNACFKIDDEYRRNDGFDKINIYLSSLYLDKNQIDSAYFYAKKIKSDYEKNEEVDKIILSETRVLLQEKKYDEAMKKAGLINSEYKRKDEIKLIEDYKNNNN